MLHTVVYTHSEIDESSLANLHVYAMSLHW